MTNRHSSNSLKTAEAYLERYFSSPGTYSLGRMNELLAHLGNPQNAVPVIHIGGTAGKGSTAYLTASILEHSGYRVGLYTSPHLVSITERIMINRTAIDEREFVRTLAAMKPAIDRVTQKYPDTPPTYFELLTAMAFVYFSREKLDVAVVEVGIGGKLDATNVTIPLASVITNVGLEHTEILGSTVEKIARDKREIIKPGVPAVSGVTQPSVRKLLIEKSNAVSSPLSLEQRDFYVKNLHTFSTTPAIAFDYVSKKHTIGNIKLSLFGRHQAHNAAGAITAITESGCIASDRQIRKALATATIAGRMQQLTINGLPALIDGAHNPMKTEALEQALRDHFPTTRFETLFAVKRDKDAPAMIRALAPHVSRWYLTTLERQTDWGKGLMLPLEHLEKIVKSADPGKPITPVPNISTFLTNAPSPLLITGSLYLVGVSLEWLSGSRT